MGCCEKHCPGGSGSGLAALAGLAVVILAAGAAVSAVIRAIAALMPAIIGGEVLAALGMITLVAWRLAPARSRARVRYREPRPMPAPRVTVLRPARGSLPVSATPRAAVPGRVLGSPQRAARGRRLPLSRAR